MGATLNPGDQSSVPRVKLQIGLSNPPIKPQVAAWMAKNVNYKLVKRLMNRPVVKKRGEPAPDLEWRHLEIWFPYQTNFWRRNRIRIKFPFDEKKVSFSKRWARFVKRFKIVTMDFMAEKFPTEPKLGQI
jgi:hypothetical protein